jgi:hypothetical protein
VIVWLWSVGARWSGLARTPEGAQEEAGKRMRPGGDGRVEMARIVYNNKLERTYEHLGRGWTGEHAGGTVTWTESGTLSEVT